MTTALLLTLPWLFLAAFKAWGIRLPPELPSGSSGEVDSLPFVSVVVPARNEAHTIRRCVDSLASLDYPRFEVVVVDDRSTDATAERARSVPPANAAKIKVLAGRELPPGWLGKPWACRQGAEEAQGEWILFTDADTRHAPPLLRRAVLGAREAGAEALSVAGAQEVGSFWERVIQPQVFALLALRYPRAGRPLPPERWRSAIAAGQYILVSRKAYAAVGGHEAVRGEVVEDLRLAQELTRAGFSPALRSAVDHLHTRMYRSLPEILEGWTKNLAVGSRQTLPAGLGLLAPWGMGLHLLTFWVLPPAVLLLALVGGVGGAPLLSWSAVCTGVGVGIWSQASIRFHSSPLYGLAFPVGAAALAWIAVRSALRGRKVVWKDREYDVGESVDRSP